MKALCLPLTGDSTLFESSTEKWHSKRKSLSAAFYKNKLSKMIDVMKDVVQGKL